MLCVSWAAITKGLLAFIAGAACLYCLRICVIESLTPKITDSRAGERFVGYGILCVVFGTVSVAILSKM